MCIYIDDRSNYCIKVRQEKNSMKTTLIATGLVFDLFKIFLMR